MAFYKEETEINKCKKHNSKRPNNTTQTGICPYCLKDRLTLLCPNCANTKPCSCLCSTSDSDSDSDSSTFSLNLHLPRPRPVSTLVNSNPNPNPRTTIFPFFRSARFSENAERSRKVPTVSVWSVFRKSKEKLSRSMSVVQDRGNETGKGNNNKWYFASPMKIFRHVKPSKVAHQRSPLHCI